MALAIDDLPKAGQDNYPVPAPGGVRDQAPCSWCICCCFGCNAAQTTDTDDTV